MKRKFREDWWSIFRRDYPEYASIHVMLNRKMRLIKQKLKEVKTQDE